MQNSMAYYGGTFLGKEELKESNINHRIKLEYYTTSNKETNDKNKIYGIQIVKKEYLKNKIETESSKKEYISNNAEKVIKIIDTLKKHKVTPIGLKDVLDDLLKIV